MKKYGLVEGSLWEVLVPAIDSTGKEIDINKHREWDSKVREISRGLTIMSTSKGQWISPKGMLFVEPMIPVRFLATDEEEVEKIVKITQEHYSDQFSIMFYKISNEVFIRY